MATEALLTYVQQQLNAGHSLDAIHGRLMQSGYTEPQIDEVFAILDPNRSQAARYGYAQGAAPFERPAQTGHSIPQPQPRRAQRPAATIDKIRSIFSNKFVLAGLAVAVVLIIILVYFFVLRQPSDTLEVIV